MNHLRQFLQKETTRNFMKLFSGTMIAQGLSFALAPVLSRLYTPEDFGLVALYLGIFSVLSVLSTAKYEQAIMLPRHNNHAMHVFWLVLLITVCATVITALAVVLANRSIAHMLGNADIAPWLYLLPLSLLLHGIAQSATFLANRNKKFGLMAGGTIAQYALLNAVRLSAGWMRTRFNGLIAGQLAGQIMAAGYMFAGVAQHVKQYSRHINLRDLAAVARLYIGYPKYNMPLNFTNNLSGSLPIFMLTWGFTPAIAGLYAFGYTFIFRPVGMFSQSALQVLSQKIIQDHHDKKPIYAGLKNLVVKLCWMAAAPAVLLALTAPSLFSFAFSEEYRLAGTFLQYLSPFLVMVFITSPLSFIPELFFRQKKAMIIDIVYLCLRFLALYLGIYYKNYLLAMGLYAGVGTLVVGYNLYWYMSLAKKHDQTLYT